MIYVPLTILQFVSNAFVSFAEFSHIFQQHSGSYHLTKLHSII